MASSVRFDVSVFDVSVGFDFFRADADEESHVPLVVFGNVLRQFLPEQSFLLLIAEIVELAADDDDVDAIFVAVGHIDERVRRTKSALRQTGANALFAIVVHGPAFQILFLIQCVM